METNREGRGRPTGEVPLDHVPLIAGLDDATRRAFADVSSVVTVDAGEVIALEGDEHPPVCFVLDGLVVGYRLGQNGRAQTLTWLSAGDPFYIPCAVGKSCRTPVSTRAVCESRLFLTPQLAFRALVDAHPQVYKDLYDPAE